MLQSFNLLLDSPRVNAHFESAAGAVTAAVVRLPRPGKKCGYRLRPKATRCDHSQLTPPSDVRVRPTFFAPRGGGTVGRPSRHLTLT
jgi:hypothetical protein